MASPSILASSSSELRWVDHIKKVFHKEVVIGNDDDIADVCIFQVPTTISSVKPQAYIPQLIALGPYHHFRPELYRMEQFKLQAGKSLLSPSQCLQFQTRVIDELVEFALIIRNCYNSYFDLDDETLAWILAIDGLFLIQFLRSLNNPLGIEGEDKEKTEEAIMRDVILLENQIPIILLKKIWRILKLSANESDLVSLLINFCGAESPLSLANESPSFLSANSVHLLDLMYQLIVRNCIQKQVAYSRIFFRPDQIEENVGKLIDIAVEGKIPGADQIQKYFKFIQGISGLVGKQKQTQTTISVEDDSESLTTTEEIEIPSVSELNKIAKVQFLPQPGGISDIEFDEEELIFYLPSLTLNVNSEVVLRNLVAYEVLSGKPVGLGQYVDLMSGIIDTPEDVNLLREAGIISGNMSDDEIAKLFNRFNKSNGGNSDGKSEIEKITDKLNEKYNNKPRIKAYNWLKKYVYGSWKCLTVVASLLLLLMLILQSFCAVFGCSRFFRTQGLGAVGPQLYVSLTSLDS